jgi:hypothetical protein
MILLTFQPFSILFFFSFLSFLFRSLAASSFIFLPVFSPAAFFFQFFFLSSLLSSLFFSPCLVSFPAARVLFFPSIISIQPVLVLERHRRRRERVGEREQISGGLAGIGGCRRYRCGAVVELVALGAARAEINTCCGGDEKEINARVDCEVVMGSR